MFEVIKRFFDGAKIFNIIVKKEFSGVFKPENFKDVRDY